MHPDPSNPVACSLGAAALAERRARIRRTLARWPCEMAPIPEGWALRFERRDEVVAELAELVALEAACCPFLTLALTIEPVGGAAWLRVTGAEGMPGWVESMLGDDTRAG